MSNDEYATGITCSNRAGRPGMAVRTGFTPLLHILLLRAGSALAQQPEAEQAGPYFAGFHHYLSLVLDGLSAQSTELQQANEVARILAEGRFGRRLHFAVAIYSFPERAGSSILPDEPRSRVDAHTKDGAAVSPYCDTHSGNPPERCVESGGSLMREYVDTPVYLSGTQQVRKYAMVFWWPTTEQRWPQKLVQGWSAASSLTAHGYLWRGSCGKYRGDDGYTGNTYASVVARCLYDTWVKGARSGQNKGPHSCRGLLFAPQGSFAVADRQGHLFQSSGYFRLINRQDESQEYVEFKIVMLP